MPAKSSAQFRAMEAAKHGRSKLGIPPKVGAEFVEETDDPDTLPPRAPKAKKARSPLADAMRRKAGR